MTSTLVILVSFCLITNAAVLLVLVRIWDVIKHTIQKQHPINEAVLETQLGTQALVRSIGKRTEDTLNKVEAVAERTKNESVEAIKQASVDSSNKLPVLPPINPI